MDCRNHVEQVTHEGPQELQLPHAVSLAENSIQAKCHAFDVADDFDFGDMCLERYLQTRSS